MFRGCYFEYAGKSSEIYDLQLFYYDRQENTFNSGGEYEIKTEALPKNSEQLLYGINYSEKPLEFEIEILNAEGVIPFEQVIEIKNWLFGQDGWKIFRTLDERQDYHLKCLLLPEEDIVDVLGYRGFKCKLHNISPFWYGAERTITITEDVLHNVDIIQGSSEGYKWVPFEVNIPENNISNFSPIYPQITFKTTYANQKIFDLGTTDLNTIDEFITDAFPFTPSVNGYIRHSDASVHFDYRLVSGISFELICLGGSTVEGKYSINTKYANVVYDSSMPVPCKAGTRLFNLKSGRNICYLRNPECVESISFTYTPVYRLGAF